MDSELPDSLQDSAGNFMREDVAFPDTETPKSLYVLSAGEADGVTPTTTGGTIPTVSSQRHTAPQDDSIIDEEPDEESQLANAISHLLVECAKWWSVVAGRTNHSWAFMAPCSDVLSKASDGLSVPKEHSVTCWSCHYKFEQEIIDTFPCKDDDDDHLVHARTVLDMCSGPNEERPPKYRFIYKTSSASTLLRQHCLKHHPKEYRMLVDMEDPKEATKRNRSQETKRTCDSTVSTAFRSVKKLRTDHPRQDLFHRLIVYVVVMLRWSFSVVDNAWFMALVWFLDPSISIPTRGTFMSSLLLGIVRNTHSEVMSRLRNVRGGTLLFDLWQSRKGNGYAV